MMAEQVPMIDVERAGMCFVIERRSARRRAARGLTERVIRANRTLVPRIQNAGDERRCEAD
jgi:hypothetical protein